MPAVQQGPDFVETEGVEVAHMGEALAGQDYSEQWASPALGSTIVDQVVDIILTTTPTPASIAATSALAEAAQSLSSASSWIWPQARLYVITPTR